MAHIVFIDLGRLRAINQKAYGMVVDHLGLIFDEDDEKEFEAISNSLPADLIRYGDLLILRTNDSINIWNEKTNKFEDRNRHKDLISRIPIDNPLRVNQ